MRYLSMLTFLCCFCLPPALAEQAMSGFKPPEEMMDNWYHRHEHEAWIRSGADAEVIEDVLHRIEQAEGERSDPGLVDTIIAYGPGNWIYEWASAGELAMARADADARKRKRDAVYAGYREALAYFTIASWPHLDNEDDRKALARARDAYLAAGRYLAVPPQHVEFAVGDTTSRGFLHLPKGRGPFPLLIVSNGSDVTKEANLGFFTEELEAAGIAMLAVDLTGIGEASHIPLTAGSDTILAAAYEFALGLKKVDGDNIFVAGASFGGHAAARFFFNHKAAGVVSMCGPLHRPFVAPPEVFDNLPALTIDGVKARLGVPGIDSVALSKLTPQLSLKNQGNGNQKIDTPLLILTTNRDPVAPLADLALLEDSATDYDKVVLDRVGHCPPRWIREPVVRRWVQDQMR